MDPRKSCFVDSSVDFNGGFTGTSLEVQIRLKPEIWLFEVDDAIMTPWDR